MRYLDTGIVIAALGGEERSPAVARWLAAHSDDCVISSWTLAELSNVFARRARAGELDAKQHDLALAAVERLTQSFGRVPLGDVDVLAASRMVDRWDVGVRAPDAIHLAIARRHGCDLVTFDRGMQAAARAFGVPLVDDVA